MSDSLETAADTSVETQNVAIVDYGEFANYIRKAATILLPEEDATAPALNGVLDDKTNQDCIKKFLSDPQIPALYVQRTCSKGKTEKDGDEEEEVPNVRYIDTGTHTLTSRLSACVCAAFVKQFLILFAVPYANFWCSHSRLV